MELSWETFSVDVTAMFVCFLDHTSTLHRTVCDIVSFEVQFIYLSDFWTETCQPKHVQSHVQTKDITQLNSSLFSAEINFQQSTFVVSWCFFKTGLWGLGLGLRIKRRSKGKLVNCVMWFCVHSCLAFRLRGQALWNTRAPHISAHIVYIAWLFLCQTTEVLYIGYSS